MDAPGREGWMLRGRMDALGQDGGMFQERMDAQRQEGCSGVGWMLRGGMDAPGQDGGGGLFLGRMDAWRWEGCSSGTQLPPPRTLPGSLTAVASTLSPDVQLHIWSRPPAAPRRPRPDLCLHPTPPRRIRASVPPGQGDPGCPGPPSRAPSTGMAQPPAPSAARAGCPRTQLQLFSHYYHYYY